ncbi:ABC transporter substrate-binding protein [Halorussus salinisoli]|uniref:ABC transporter substrate-binding protein n=1 Tax=Halorussus salinisoli TaxID=2558242 RepID=UPI0010C1DB61|nr:extracellular solute-binding protein [Halorussus salinisoli]
MTNDKRGTSDQVNRRNVLKGLSVTGLGSIAGCTGGGASVGQETTTTVEGDWPDLSGQEVHFLVDETSDAFRNFFSNVGSDFQAATGATVRMEYQATGGSAEERLAQLLQSGDPPEVLLSSVSQSALFAVRGIAAPVNEAFQAATDRYGEPRQRMQYQGDEYMMPFGSNIGMFWYRTDLYDEAPTTWESLLQGAQNVQENTDLNGTALLGGTSFCTELQLMSFAYSAGANVAENNDGDINVIMAEGSNRDRWIQTLSYLQDLKSFSGGNEDIGCEGSTVLANENSAHAWWVGSRPKNQCVVQDRPFAGDVAAVQQPGPGTEGALTCGLTDGLITFQDADVEAAQTYMEFFAQPKYFTQIMAITPIHIIPPFPGIFELPAVQQQLNELPDVWTDHDIQTMKNATENYTTLADETDPPNPYSGAIYGSNILSDIMYDATINQRDPAAIVDEYAPQIQNVVDQAQQG